MNVEPSSTSERTSRYAPAREDGMKPWAVDFHSWGKVKHWIVWENTAALARWRVVGRQKYCSAVVRRATPADMQERREYA